MKVNKGMVVAAVSVVVLIGGALVGPIMSNVEKPGYEVISADDNIEIRQYGAMIVAEVEVQGPRETAIEDGFKLLADYIFGNNTVQKSIAMTAPVQQQPNEKIAMTAPVQQQAAGDSWKVSFVMPSEFSLNTLPKPNNDRVKLHEIAARRFVAIGFSGTNSNDNLATHEKQLRQYIEKNQIQTTGTPTYAFYNPPGRCPLCGAMKS